MKILAISNDKEDIAYELLNSLPLVKNGLIGFQAMSLHPYTGYDRIFIKKV